MRCKNCKELFEVKRFNQKFCSSPDCQTKEAMLNLKKIKDKELKDWNKRRRIMIEDGKTWEDDFQITLRTFNKYIRLRDSKEPCISCDAKAGRYRITSGHFYPQGTYRNIALDERNANGQCWYNCNKNKHGNLQEYRPRLIKKIGRKEVERLDELAHEKRKYTREELRELNEYYKQKIKELQSIK